MHTLPGCSTIQTPFTETIFNSPTTFAARFRIKRAEAHTENYSRRLQQTG